MQPSGTAGAEATLPLWRALVQEGMAEACAKAGDTETAARHYGEAARLLPARPEYRAKQAHFALRSACLPASARAAPSAGHSWLIHVPPSFPGLVPSGSGPVRFRVTRDPALRAEADAVLWHIPDFRRAERIATRPGQLAVASSMECAALYPLLDDAAFMAQFDVTMTYRRDATIWCSYLSPDVAAAMRRPPQPKTEKVPVACFQSNTSHTSYDRDGYLEELMRHVAIDCYGRAFRNRSLPEDRGRSSKLATCARYKFTIAFENSVDEDYVSEKFFDPLVAGSVPVYFGAPNIGRFAPANGCYINAADFADPVVLGTHLLALDADDVAYQTFLDWRSRPFRPEFEADVEVQRLDGLSRIALLLEERAASGQQSLRDRRAPVPGP